MGLAERGCPLSLSAGPLSLCSGWSEAGGERWDRTSRDRKTKLRRAGGGGLEGGPRGLPRAACSWKKGSELPSLPGQGSERSPNTTQGWTPQGPPPMQPHPMPGPHPYAWPSPLFPGPRAGTTLAPNALSWRAGLRGPLSAQCNCTLAPSPAEARSWPRPGMWARASTGGAQAATIRPTCDVKVPQGPRGLQLWLWRDSPGPALSRD